MAEEHLLLVTQERSIYEQEVDESRRQVQGHFLEEGVFVLLVIPFRCTIRLILRCRCITPATLAQSTFLTPRKAAIPREVKMRPVIQARGRTQLLVFFRHYGRHHQSTCCSGQNKNNTMVQYLMWRVLTGLHQTIKLHFMITATRSSPPTLVSVSSRGSFAKPTSALWTTWLT